MKHFALTICLLAIVGFAWANPADRESRQVMPERIPEGVLLLDDGFVGRRQLISDDMIEPLIISTRKFGSIPVVTSDQQAEEQRYPYGGYGGGGWGGGRPYGGGWGGGRPYGGGWGGGRPYGGGGWGGGRPWW